MKATISIKKLLNCKLTAIGMIKHESNEKNSGSFNNDYTHFSSSKDAKKESHVNLPPGDETEKVHIPVTISDEAKEVLDEWTIQSRNDEAHMPKGDAPAEEWAEKQDEFQETAKDPLPELLDKFKPKVDTVFFGGIRAIDVKPKDYQKSDKIVIYIHGGAYTFFTADVTLLSSVPLADLSGLRIVSIDYTLAPHAKFDQIIDEILTFYQALLKEYKAENIVIYGDSAGGGLTAGSILKMRDQSIELPRAVVLWSPWADIDQIGDTYFTMADNDPNLVFEDFLENCAEAYAPRDEWKNPYVSPVYGDYSKDFPPTLIQVGGKEIFMSNSIRMYRALKENNKEVELDVYEGMWHVWQGYYNIPESKMAVKNTKNFIFKHLGISSIE
ncbi:MAG: alpha/beta hydrolase [Bacteroidota bacterium]